MIILGICILLSACIPNKKVIYLQASESNYKLDSLITQPYAGYILKKGDMISIEVRSVDPMLTQIFQPNIGGSMNPMVQPASGGDLNYSTGYALNENGDVALPMIGFVHLAGLSLEESKQTLAIEISKYISDPYIMVRLGGIQYSTLGEFNNPGIKSILQPELTILEAIAASGDLTILADRKEIVLIRKYEGGVKRHELDLTDERILTSPYYFIHPGDQLYAQPLPIRPLGIGVNGTQTFTTILSTVSSVLLIIITLNQL